ncbi:hypothetical protein WAX46_12330 [Bacillus sp. FJAT-53060]|nr:hypothetical protein [Bacillus stratosphericus]
MKNHVKVENHAGAKRVNRKNHAGANTDLIIRKAAESHTAAIDLNVLITTDEVTIAEDAGGRSIIPETEEMLIENGIKGICGSIDATANIRSSFLKPFLKESMIKKGFFLFCREIK